MIKVIRNVAFLIIVFFIFLSSNAYSQDKPRIAVIPFSSVGVSEIESLTASSLFETALVQTDKFIVIEQNHIKEILNAQAFTLTGYIDDNHAVEIGKILAAEKIVLGTLSSVGKNFVLNAKIIDVTLGQNINAEKVVFTSIDKLPDSADELAYKLAGYKKTEKQSAIAFSDEFRNDTYVIFLATQEEFETEYKTISGDAVSVFPSKVEKHLKTMIDSKYTFSDIESRADKLLTESKKKKAEYDRIKEINKLNNEIAYFNIKLGKEKKAVKRSKFLKYVFATGSLGSFAAGLYFNDQVLKSESDYKKAKYIEDIDKYADEIEEKESYRKGFYTISALFAVTSVIFWIKKDKSDLYHTKIKDLQNKKTKIEGKL